MQYGLRIAESRLSPAPALHPGRLAAENKLWVRAPGNRSASTDPNVLNLFAFKARPARQSPDPDRQEDRNRGGWPQDDAGGTQA